MIEINTINPRLKEKFPVLIFNHEAVVEIAEIIASIVPHHLLASVSPQMVDKRFELLDFGRDTFVQRSDRSWLLRPEMSKELKSFAVEVNEWIRTYFKNRYDNQLLQKCNSHYANGFTGLFKSLAQAEIEEFAPEAIIGRTFLEGGDVFVFQPAQSQYPVAIIGSYSFLRNFMLLSKLGFDEEPIDEGFAENDPISTQISSTLESMPLIKNRTPQQISAALSWTLQLLAEDLGVDPGRLFIFEQSKFHIDLEISVTPRGEVLMNHSEPINEILSQITATPPKQASQLRGCEPESALVSSVCSEMLGGRSAFAQDEGRPTVEFESNSQVSSSLSSISQRSPSFFAKGDIGWLEKLDRTFLKPTRDCCNPKESINEFILKSRGLKVLRVPGIFTAITKNRKGILSAVSANFLNGVYFNGSDEAGGALFITSGFSYFRSKIKGIYQSHEYFETLFSSYVRDCLPYLKVAFCRTGEPLEALAAGLRCVSHPGVWRGSSLKKEIGNISFVRV